LIYAFRFSLITSARRNPAAVILVERPTVQIPYGISGALFDCANICKAHVSSKMAFSMKTAKTPVLAIFLVFSIFALFAKNPVRQDSNKNNL
jgi:hypothetical protein